MRILYDSKKTMFKTPFGCTEAGEPCRINIHIPQSCITKKVTLITEGEDRLEFTLDKTDTKDAYDIFSGDMILKKPGLYFYHFFIETAQSSFELYKLGSSDTNIGEGDKWQISCIPKGFTTPDEFKGRVMYQIFPDRFFKVGSPDLTDKLTPYTVHENTKEVPHYLPDEYGKILNNDFYGGNLQGIAQKLPYLKELGVGIIYLNPIFKAFSNHRYDTCDYKTIDPMLGDEADFKELCERAHEADIRILLDGVFSHTGSDSIYFDKPGRFGDGAYHNKTSPYRSWFNIGENGEYDSWWGIDTLPCVNELSSDYIKYIITDEDSVIKHWLSLGAYGFRLDVADELPDEFIRLLHKEVKKFKPDAIVLGEVWEDASNKIAYDVRRRYFTDTELDSVMNYPFREAIIALVQGYIGTEAFADRVLTITENYPKEVTDCLMNSLSTHDTARIFTVLTGAPQDMSREDRAAYAFSKEELSRANELIKLAVMLQFFLPGSACIYYGDETGMHGFGDPFNRAHFDWDNTENEINDFYRAMAKIKNENKAFKKGEIKFLRSENGILVMERTDGENSVFAAVNLSEESLKINTTRCLACHNATCLDKTVYVQKNGFVIY